MQSAGKHKFSPVSTVLSTGRSKNPLENRGFLKYMQTFLHKKQQPQRNILVYRTLPKTACGQRKHGYVLHRRVARLQPMQGHRKETIAEANSVPHGPRRNSKR